MLLLIALVLPGWLCAQTGISTSASRQITMQADEAAFVIEVTAALDSTASQIAEALQSAGLPALDLVSSTVGFDQYSAAGGATGESPARYTFRLVQAPDRYRDAAKRLEEFSHATDKWPEALKSFTFRGGISVSQRSLEAARQRLFPELLAEARRKAELIAAAAGIRLGAVEMVTENQNPGYWLDSATFLPGYSFSSGLIQTFGVWVRFSRA